MKVLITGATGLLGNALIQEFASHFDVYALHRSTSTLPAVTGVKWVLGDLQEISSMHDFLAEYDFVIHAAALVSFTEIRPQDVIDFNVESTKAIVNACLDLHKKLLFVSSVAALGSEPEKLTTEKDDFDTSRLQTNYAWSKHLSEMEVWRGISEGLQAIIVNPSIILGIPSSWEKSSGSFWTRIDKGLNRYPIGATGFVDARDVALACRLFIQNNCYGERFIVNSTNWKYKEFFHAIKQSLGKDSRLVPLKRWQSSILWRLALLFSVFNGRILFPKAMHQTVCSTVKYSSDKLLNTIDMKYRTIEDTIQWVSNAYQKQSE